MDSELRLPPQSVESEQSVIGALLLDNDAWDLIADILEAADFYTDIHRIIYLHVGSLIVNGSPADVITVSDSLTAAGKLEFIGGIAYLAGIAQNTPSAANVRKYASIVREKAVLRQLASVGTQVIQSAFEPKGQSAKVLLDSAESLIFEIAEHVSRNQAGGRDLSDFLPAVIDEIDDRYQKGESDLVTGVPTRFTEIDKMTSGLQKGDLIIVAGRPSMGKTAFAINIAENVAIEVRQPVIIFSMEMSGKKLSYRMLSSIGKVHGHALRTGQLDDEHWHGLTLATAKLSDATIHIDDTPGLTAMDIRTRTRRFARRYGGEIGLVVVNYIQMLSTQASAEGNRAYEVGEISRSLKNLARELNVPVIALSQLSRKVEERVNKRPMMSDLRESGSLEQDADVIMLLYRDEYYNPDSEFKGVAEINVAKQRDGATGVVSLAFRGEFSRFENLSPRNAEYDS